MPQGSNKDVTIKISADAHSLLRKIKKSSELDQKQILELLLELCEDNDLLNPGWQKRLTASLVKGARHIESSKFRTDLDRCPALAEGEEKFKCVWGRKGEPPKIKILEKEYETTKEICSKCRITLEIYEENQEYLNEIEALKKKLETKRLVTFKAPVCKMGAILGEDGKSFSGCRKSSIPVSVEGFCKAQQQGQGCPMYGESVIGIGNKESDSARDTGK